MQMIGEAWCPGCGHYLGWSDDDKYRACADEQCPYSEGGIPVDYMPTLETKILEVAEKIKKRNEATNWAGKPYRPSNGTEGAWFESKWCERCEMDRAYREDETKPSCPILIKMLGYDTDAPEYPGELVYDKDGNPCCTAFQEVDGELRQKQTEQLAKWNEAMGKIPEVESGTV